MNLTTLLLLLILIPASSLRLTAPVFSVSSWTFVSRFCYSPVPDELSEEVSQESQEFGTAAGSEYGELTLAVTYSNRDRLKLLFYWGSFKDWLQVYGSPYSDLSCADREALASHQVPLHLNTTTVAHLPPLDGDKSGTHTRAVVSRTFVAREAYYFFAVLSNCGGEREGGVEGGVEGIEGGEVVYGQVRVEGGSN